MPTRPPAAIVALVLVSCTPRVAPEPEEPEAIVELPPPPKPRKPMPTQAQFEAAWVIVGDPPPLARVPDPCEMLAGYEPYDPDLHCNPPTSNPMPPGWQPPVAPEAPPPVRAPARTEP